MFAACAPAQHGVQWKGQPAPTFPCTAKALHAQLTAALKCVAQPDTSGEIFAKAQSHGPNPQVDVQYDLKQTQLCRHRNHQNCCWQKTNTNTNEPPENCTLPSSFIPSTLGSSRVQKLPRCHTCGSIYVSASPAPFATRQTFICCRRQLMQRPAAVLKQHTEAGNHVTARRGNVEPLALPPTGAY